MTGTLTTDLVLIKLAQNDAFKEDLQILSHLSRDKFVGVNNVLYQMVNSQ